MMGIAIIKSATNASGMDADLSWSFVEDGDSESYGIFYSDGTPLERNYDEEGEPDGWVFEEQKAVVSTASKNLGPHLI